MSEMARVIRPMTVTPAALISSNVPENDAPLWSPDADYDAGAQVMLDHAIYQAAVANKGRNPATDTTFPAAWVRLNATNRWRMFDQKVGTQTTSQGGLVVEIQADGFIDSVAILNAHADSARVTMIDPVEGVVFEREAVMLDAGVRNWWQYFFKPIRRRKDVIIDDLPPYAGVTIRVELFIVAANEAKLGALILGSRFEIGCARWGSSVGIRDFSQKETDQWGNIDVVPGPRAKRPELDLIIDTDRVDYVMEELSLLASIPCVYIGHRRHTMTIALGFYRELLTVLSNPSVSECTLTIEALT